MTQKIFLLFLYLHIALGSTGLIAGAITLILKKGDARHKKIGKLFAYAMLGSAAASFVIAVLHDQKFLFIVGVFTVYLIGTGMRYLRQRRAPKPQAIDWTLSIFMLVFGTLFVVYAAYLFYYGNNFGSVLLVFGLISLALVQRDYTFYFKTNNHPKMWLLEHITRMVAGEIASFTAFVVVNNTLLPDVLAWLLPTVIGTVLITIWRKRVKENYELKAVS